MSRQIEGLQLDQQQIALLSQQLETQQLSQQLFSGSQQQLEEGEPIYQNQGIRDIMQNLFFWFGHVKNCPRQNMANFGTSLTNHEQISVTDPDWKSE